MAREGLTEEDRQQLKQEILKLGIRTVRNAKQLCPVDTGRLRASITVADSEGLVQPIDSEAKSGDGVEAPTENFVVRVGTNVDYAKFIEFGTVNRAPQPFLRPGLNKALQQTGFER